MFHKQVSDSIWYLLTRARKLVTSLKTRSFYNALVYKTWHCVKAAQYIISISNGKAPSVRSSLFVHYLIHMVETAVHTFTLASEWVSTNSELNSNFFLWRIYLTNTYWGILVQSHEPSQETQPFSNSLSIQLKICKISRRLQFVKQHTNPTNHWKLFH